jgi:hypothetical protein
MRPPVQQMCIELELSGTTFAFSFIALFCPCGKTNGIIMIRETSCVWWNRLCSSGWPDSELSVRMKSHSHAPGCVTRTCHMDTWCVVSRRSSVGTVCLVNCGTLPRGLPALCRTPPYHLRGWISDMLDDYRCIVCNVLAFRTAVGLSTSIFPTPFYAVLEW